MRGRISRSRRRANQLTARRIIFGLIIVLVILLIAAFAFRRLSFSEPALDFSEILNLLSAMPAFLLT